VNRFTKGKGVFGSVTLDGGFTMKGNAKGNVDITGYSKAAAGSNGLYYAVVQDDDIALTGTLRGAYVIATNGTTAATGGIEGLNVKARAADASNVGANVALMTGVMVSVDVKNKAVTDLRGIEVSLDGGAGGSATTVYGVEISNNTSATFTTTYGLAFNFGSPSGRAAFTRDILLQNGASIDNATVGQVEIVIPERASASYAYGVKISADDDFFVGGAATKSYLLSVSGDRPVASAATGDSNDALIRASGNNYAANDANFIFRAINASINNRDGGVLGRLEGASIGTQGKSGGTVSNIVGMTVTAENYGTVSDMFGGIDVLLKNEAAVATTEYGIRIRNENNSIAGPVAAAIVVSDTGANTGWTDAFDLSGATLASLMDIPAAICAGGAGSGADVYIDIKIAGVAARITAKYVA
jgi:hypothetical protein